ncbi:hypothetical protein [Lysinibacillus sp. NPDC093692]|uniref:hypothetical protein n=1 Tax=Lysinibacillus sp. NPDC093692 TaxID=3390578 RepID=UPI003D041D95
MDLLNYIESTRPYSAIIIFTCCEKMAMILVTLIYNLSLFSKRHSVLFCIGQINVYFTESPDDTFWRIYANYAAMNIVSMIVWTKKYDEQSFDDALERIHLILANHDYFNLVQPLRYKSIS